MRYLHCCYSHNWPDHLLFFGEDRNYIAPKKRGRRPKIIHPAPHPHGLSYESLFELIELYHPVSNVDQATVTLTLPAVGIIPLRPDETETNEKTSFIPLHYNAIKVPLDKLSELLPAMVMKHQDDVVLTDSIRFFGTAFSFALEFIVRESFLPALDENGPDGRWAAFFGPDELERIKDLAGAMPCLCYSFHDRKCAPVTLLKMFISSCTNSVLKSALKKSKIPLIGRAQAGTRMESRWILELWGKFDRDTKPLPNDQVFFEKGAKWLGLNLDETNERPFYTCLRLREPSEQSSDFQVEFLLRACDDPSLIIPSKEIWKKGSSITYLNRRFDRPQEQILSDLFRAGTIFPPIQEALRSRAPTGVVLKPDQVYPFLKNAAPLLQQLNIPVLLPAWWKESSKRPAMHLSVSSKRKKSPGSGHGFFSIETILSYKWEISIGDVKISADEFENLVSLKMPLVHIGGKWVSFSPQDVMKAVNTFTKTYPGGKISATDALRLGLTGTDDNGLDVNVTGDDDESVNFFSRLLDDKVTKKFEKIPVPRSFKGKLRAYQKRGLSWLSFITGSGLGACLADDMGLGKTVQLIAYILSEKKRGMDGTTLLICPMSLIGNWQREITRFAPSLSVYIHHGTERIKSDEFLVHVGKHDIVLSTYQLVYRDKEIFKEFYWSLIAIDEAQNIKNSSTRQAKAVRSLSGARKIALTGTPVENRLTELWSIMEFLNPGYLGTSKSFEKAYSLPIEKYHDKEVSDRLKRLIQPFVLRRVKTDRSIIADLPDKNVMKRYCTLTQEQATLYQAMVESVLTEVDDAEGIARRAKILTALLRFKQICNHPDAFLNDGNLVPERSGKISLLFSLLEEVTASGDAAILFTQFSTFGERLAKLIQSTYGEEVLFLHGKTPKKSRDEMVQRFSHPNGPKFFVLSLKAGGVGLNLTRANHVFHIDRWWNPAVEDQATDRAYRIGQQKNVSVHLLISSGTIEDRIDMLMEKKRSLAGSIIGNSEDWVTSLSTDELKNLLTLQGELIGGQS